MASRYNDGRKLAGVIYLHRISDNRMGGIARRNFLTFRKLCGENSLKNVLIVTTMWTVDKSSPTRQAEERREAQLAAGDDFFKPALDKGARMVRHDGTATSALDILRMIVNTQAPKPTVPLHVQTELVDEKKPLMQTEVGQGLHQYLQEKAKEHQKEVQQTKEQYGKEIESIEQQGHENARRILGEVLVEAERLKQELEEIMDDLQRRLEKIERQVQILAEENVKLRKNLGEKIRDLIRNLESAENKVQGGASKGKVQEGASKGKVQGEGASVSQKPTPNSESAEAQSSGEWSCLVQ